MVATGDLGVEGAVAERSPVAFLVVLAVAERSPVAFLVVLGEPSCYWRIALFVAVLGIFVVCLDVLG